MLARRSILFAATVASTAAAGAWVGCSPTAPQLLAPDAALPVFDGAVLPTVTYDGGPEPVRVAAASLAGPIAGAMVVFHDTNGKILGTTTTDAAGHAERLLPAGTAVSVLVGDPSTSLSVTTYLGVEPGDLVVAYDPSVFPSNNYVDVASVPGSAPDAAVGYGAFVGRCSSGYYGVPPLSVYLSNNCFNPAGQFPVLVEAYDQLSTPLGYAFMKTQTLDLDAGATIYMDAASWATTPEATWTVNVTNATTQPYVVFRETANYVPMVDATYGQATPDGGYAPFTFPTHPGYADFVQTEVNAQSSNSYGSTFTLVATRSPAPKQDGSITLDMSQLPPNIDTVTPDFSVAAQPSVTFQPNAPIPGAVGTVVQFNWTSMNDASAYVNNSWTIVAPPNVTTVTAPELPASAVAWTPVDQVNTPSATITVMAGDGLTDYAAFRRVVGIMPAPDYANLGDAIAPLLPVDGTLTLTVVGPNLE